MIKDMVTHWQNTIVQSLNLLALAYEGPKCGNEIQCMIHKIQDVCVEVNDSSY